ncbi:phage tail protein [Lactiplantibacillus plantarum]|uniref:phage tail protein n=1 Tax=Lactiplantibacillus plantarum TaxID=1590 RepID=UPI001F4D0121|nr:phage tail protein [Lactiplantibacillus plantarum]MCH8624501.1 phage tail protein [Lactiplantibacillus plantarum]
MAESNATQVILTDDGIKIINAQNTADNAASQAENADSAALIAQSTANAAKSAADSNYNYANSEIAVQSNATAKAQSTADTAFSQAQAVGSQASAEINSNSTATAKAQSTADNAFSQATTAIDNGEVTSQAVTNLKDGSKLTIADLENGLATKVANSDYASYKIQTASQIAQKVDNGAFLAYQTTTADLIASKVATSDFSAYQATTAKSIDSKVESSDFNTYKTQTADLIDAKVSSSEYASDKTQTASEIADRVSNSAFSTYQTQTASQIASKVDNGAFSTYQTQTADLIAEKVATSDFSAYQATTAKSIDSKVESSDFNTYKTQTADTIASKVDNGDFSTYKAQTADDINLRVTKDDLIDEINLQAGNTLISSSGQLTLSGNTIYFDTVNPVIIPNANIADTLNGKTFHGGDVISNANNTAKYYPMTITPDGAYKSTYFDNAVGLQSSVESGAISYKHRSMIGSGQYLAYDSVINGQGFESQSGYTSAKDTTFSNPETITGYVNVTPASGIYLYGPTQKISFAGNADNIGSNGITMDAYGNIYAQANSSYWRIRDINSNDIADFGIDTAGANNILLHRELDIGNIQINTGHTFTSADNGAIHFAMGKGGAADIYAGAVNYTSLVKSSLLSVKKDVKKADTSYWAQLVNSIDLATYQYKTDDNTSQIRLSSIVDDVNDTKQWRLPDVFINRDEDGKLNGVDDSVLLNATLATVQEQQKEIDQLNGHNMELEARLNKLEAKLNG